MSNEFGSDQNPYATNSNTPLAAVTTANNELAARGETMLIMLLVLAILQIIVGIMELGMGGIFAAYGFFLPMFFAEAAKQNPGQPPPPPEVLMGITWYVAVLGALMIIASILRIVSGIRLFSFKGRKLTITSLILSLAGIGSCYCAFTSIPMAVFGLIVMLSPIVVYAFGLRRDGMTPRQIRDHFASARFQQPRV